MKVLLYIIGFLYIIGIMSLVSAEVWGEGPNPVAYYSFNETSGDLIDIVDGTVNGTLSGSITRSVSGIINDAYYFDDTTDFVTIGDTAEIDLSENISIGIWVNITNVTNTVQIVEKGVGVGDRAYWIQLLLVSGNLRARGTIYESDDDQIETLSTSILPYDTWVHIGMVTNGTHVSLFINGTLENVIAYDGTIKDSTEDLIIGENSGVWNGTIDELGLWDTDLTPEEMDNLFQRAEGLSIHKNSPAHNSLQSCSPLIFNATLTPAITGDTNLTNATFYVWWANGTLFNSTSVSTTGTTSNDSILSIVMPTSNFSWNVFACSDGNGESTCRFGLFNFSFTYGLSDITESLITPIYETDSTTFNVTFNFSSGTPSGNLIFDGTRYAGTVTSLGGVNYRLSRDLQVPVNSIGTKTTQWEILLDNFNYTTFGLTQIVNATNFTLCSSSPLNVPFINISYVNETVAQENTTAFISESTWVYWLGSGSVNKTLTYSDTFENSSHVFCGNPPHKTFNVDLTYSYDNSEAQQRIWNPGTQTLSNSTLNKRLFLLPTNDGIFVTFQVLNLAEQPVSGAEMTITRSGYGTIAQETTGPSGTVTIFLNPNFQYTLNVEASGFPDFTATQTFPETEYSITLGASATVADDYIKGININIRPLSGHLFNNTQYNFNYTINSTFWSLEEFGFTLTNSTGGVIGSNSSTSAAGGFLDFIYTTTNDTLITMEYYWVINSSYNNRTISWYIGPEVSGSIQGFFNRLRTYINQGMFGLNNFSVAIILFIMIFLFTGILSFKFGLTSPVAILLASTVFVIIIDIINILPNPTGVRFLPSIIMVVLLIIFAFGGER